MTSKISSALVGAIHTGTYPSLRVSQAELFPRPCSVRPEITDAARRFGEELAAMPNSPDDMNMAYKSCESLKEHEAFRDLMSREDQIGKCLFNDSGEFAAHFELSQERLSPEWIYLSPGWECHGRPQMRSGFLQGFVRTDLDLSVVNESRVDGLMTRYEICTGTGRFTYVNKRSGCVPENIGYGKDECDQPEIITMGDTIFAPRMATPLNLSIVQEYKDLLAVALEAAKAREWNKDWSFVPSQLQALVELAAIRETVMSCLIKKGEIR